MPEYCKIITETEVAQHAFELIFAFDEIVALGYRENVNLSQIRTFTDMDSHDENVYKMIKKVRACVSAEGRVCGVGCGGVIGERERIKNT